MLRVNGLPAKIPSHMVESLLRRYLEGEWDGVRNAGIPLGARVAIVEGQFNDMVGTVAGIKRRIATVKIKGKRQPVQVLEFSLRPA